MAVAVKNDFDAIVIGGGFYGTIISIYLSQHKKFPCESASDFYSDA